MITWGLAIALALGSQGSVPDAEPAWSNLRRRPTRNLRSGNKHTKAISKLCCSSRVAPSPSP